MRRPINDEIVEMVHARLQKGFREYGQEVESGDPRDFLQEALEEALDMAVYLAARIIELKDYEKHLNKIGGSNQCQELMKEKPQS